MADRQARGAARIAAVGDQCDVLAYALAFDERGRVEHLLHARAALRSLITDDECLTWFQRVVENDLDRLLLRFDDERGTTELPDLLRHTCGLHHGAIRGEVAAQHGETAFGHGGMVDVVDRAVHTVGVKRIEFRLMGPWLGGDDVARSRPVEVLGVFGAGVAHDVPLVELGLERGVVDRMHIAVELAGTVELTQDSGDASGSVHVGDLPFAGWRCLADARHSMRDAFDVIECEVDVRRLCHRENVQHGVRRAAHRHIHRHGVLEGVLRGDRTGEHGFVVMLVVLVGDLDHLLCRPFEQLLAVAVRGEHRAVAGQCKADRLREAVHRVRGEHAGA